MGYPGQVTFIESQSLIGGQAAPKAANILYVVWEGGWQRRQIHGTLTHVITRFPHLSVLPWKHKALLASSVLTFEPPIEELNKAIPFSPLN